MKFILPKSHKGFTLIELLIVIALLGALAVGLIGAIDPFEQLKKGADTGTRDIVNQVQTAIIRYYSVKNAFPWCPTRTNCVDPASEVLDGTNMSTAVANMVDAGELKSDFTKLQQNNLKLVFVTGNSTTNSVVVCYQPTSKSFKADLNTKFKINGDDQAGCISETPGGLTNCYWCIR